MKLIWEVHWDDAWVSCEDLTKAEAKKLKSVKRTTIGYFVESTEEGVVLCTDFFTKEPESINTVMFIPWGMISQAYELEIKD